METVLRATFPRIGEVDRKFGQVKPTRDLIKRKPNSSSRSFGSRKQSSHSRPCQHRTQSGHSKHAHVPDIPDVDSEQAAEELEEEELETLDGGEAAEVYEQELGEAPEPQEEAAADEDGAEEADGDSVPEHEVLEAFVAGWRAKQQTAGMRKKRGFAPKPKNSSTNSSTARIPEPPPNDTVDQRKARIRCAACKKIGHWLGDPECPKVNDGTAPLRNPSRQ